MERKGNVVGRDAKGQLVLAVAWDAAEGYNSNGNFKVVPMHTETVDVDGKAYNITLTISRDNPDATDKAAHATPRDGKAKKEIFKI